MPRRIDLVFVQGNSIFDVSVTMNTDRTLTQRGPFVQPHH